MVGIVDSSKRSFEVYGTLQRVMRCTALAAFLVLLLLMPAVSSQTSGRDAPNCLERDIDQLLNSISVDSGVCVKVDLGTLQPGDVYDVSVSIINDEIDLLFFDQNQILTYDAGQSYRSQYNQIISTESALGGYDFHWKTPSSLNPKTWYMVLDNLAHDGDNGQGDQGGLTSQVGVTFSKIEESYWTPFHDVIAVDANDFTTLLSGDALKLDAGTTVVVTAWALEGEADIYLQTRAMHDLYVSGEVGQLFIQDLDLQSVIDSDSDSWTVPQELDGEELLVIVDNTDSPVGGGIGDSDIRISVRVELAPVINPIINAINNGSTTIGQTLSLDANDSPNKIGQISTLSWDFDDSIDVDQDGIFTNDNEAQGFEAEALWTTIGTKIVTLTTTSPNSQISITNYSIEVSDIVAPNPVISSSAELFTGGWKTSINQETAFSCSSSTDDDIIASCLWEWGSVFSDTNSSTSITWPNIGTYQVNLTVVDNSGNSATTTAIVVVDDSSIPSLNQQSIEQLPSSTIEGESLTLSIDAIDAYDQSYQLVYHWDLNPSSDSDANGDPTDDPDYIGSSVDVEFDQGGRKDIVVTVFDQSGNSDSHAFSINVDNAAEPTSAVGLVMVAMFVGVITISVAMIGFRRWQAGIAVQLLQGRGLSEAEAKQHIAMVKQRTKIPIFADASVIAGLDSGQQIVTSEQKSQQRQDAEYQSIYGNSSNQSQASESFAPPTNMYAPSGFAPTQSQYGMGTQSAAADAMAMFAEEENEEIIETNKQEGVIEKVTKVISGGIELPHQVKSQIEVNDMEEDQHLSVESTEDFSTENQNVQQVSCPLCSSNFKIEIPDVDEAIVECPTCNQDFMLRFD
ncbi:MAG: PKD domain-containing protein [Candidatus Poseidoniaceae archaeon]|nr:PKD domain-containing protein [Candidatus Poseidoniaceae archaeon]